MKQTKIGNIVPIFTARESDMLNLYPDGSLGGGREGRFEVSKSRRDFRSCGVQSDLSTLFGNILLIAILPLSQNVVNLINYPYS